MRTKAQEEYLASWQETAPALVERWKKDGTLDGRLLEAETSLMEAEAMAQRDEMTHLSRPELVEMYAATPYRLETTESPKGTRSGKAG